MYPAHSIFFERGEELVFVGIMVYSFCEGGRALRISQLPDFAGLRTGRLVECSNLEHTHAHTWCFDISWTAWLT
jgi:hypothetical protein